MAYAHGLYTWPTHMPIQGLCDYEGHLIVRSFHGEGEGLHNYTHYGHVVQSVGYMWVLRAEQGRRAGSYNYDKVLL